MNIVINADHDYTLVASEETVAKYNRLMDLLADKGYDQKQIVEELMTAIEIGLCRAIKKHKPAPEPAVDIARRHLANPQIGDLWVSHHRIGDTIHILDITNENDFLVWMDYKGHLNMFRMDRAKLAQLVYGLSDSEQNSVVDFNNLSSDFIYECRPETNQATIDHLHRSHGKYQFRGKSSEDLRLIK